MDNKERPVISVIASLGFIAKGVVYFLIGVLAFQTSWGLSGQRGSTTQALQTLTRQPLGSILLTGCIIGLLAHAARRVINAIWDPENRGNSPKMILIRFLDFIVAGLYLSISYAAWQILQGAGAQSSSKSTKVWIGKILEIPYGKWIVMLCAVITLLVALYQFYMGYKANFEYRFDESEMNSTERNTICVMGRIGFFAWGVVYLMMTILFYRAAVNFDASQAGGLSDALQALQNQPHGLWILNITAAGLLIYGLYLLVLSYYHQLYQ